MASSLFGVVIVFSLPAIYIAFVAWVVVDRNAATRPTPSAKSNLRAMFTFLAIGAFVVGLIAKFLLNSVLSIQLPPRTSLLLAIAAGAVGVALSKRAALTASSATAPERPLSRTRAVDGNGIDAGGQTVVAAALDHKPPPDEPHPNPARLHEIAGTIARTVLVTLNTVALLACALTWLSWPVLSDGRFDDDADEATALLVLFAAFLAMSTGAMTGVAIRMRYVRKRWIIVPTALLVIAAAIGAGLYVVSLNHATDYYGAIP